MQRVKQHMQNMHNIVLFSRDSTQLYSSAETELTALTARTAQTAKTARTPPSCKRNQKKHATPGPFTSAHQALHLAILPAQLARVPVALRPEPFVEVPFDADAGETCNVARSGR